MKTPPTLRNKQTVLLSMQQANDWQRYIQERLQYAEDDALKQMLAPLLDGQLWEHIVWLGTWMRLHQLTPQKRRQTIAELLAGELPTSQDMMAPREWIRAQTPSSRQHIQKMFADKCRQLHQVLASLIHTQPKETPPPAPWQEELLTWLTQRDDLESVRALLHVCGEDQEAAKLLKAYDHSAREWFDQLPEHLDVPTSPRLQRVQYNDPDAWWGR